MAESLAQAVVLAELAIEEIESARQDGVEIPGGVEALVARMELSKAEALQILAEAR